MNLKFPNTISFRLAASIVFIFLTFLLLIFYFILVSIEHRVYKDADQKLIEDIFEYKVILHEAGLEKVLLNIEQDLEEDELGDDIIRILNKQGKEIYSSVEQYHPLTKHDTTEDINSIVVDKNIIVFNTLEFSLDEITDYRYAVSDFGSNHYIFIAEPLQILGEVQELLSNAFIIIFLSTLIPIILLSWFIAKHTVRGIKEVNRAANEIKQGNLDSRAFVTDQSDEVLNLSKTFNEMADRIQSLINEMRDMIDNIAHDLKSPLGRIRMIAESTLTGNKEQNNKSAAEDTLIQCDTLLQYINTTLEVAEVEAGLKQNQFIDVDLSSITHDASDLFHAVAAENNITLETNIEMDCVIKGHKQNLQRMIANIIDNAIKFSKQDSTITASLAKTNHHISLSIADTGPGIPESEQTRIFDRFYRCDQSRNQEGSGLGLSYARAVARAHNGDIELVSVVGEGSTFTIKLPR